MDSTEKLLYFSGVAADYLDYGGNHHAFTREQRCRVLSAMGFDVDDPAAVEKAVFDLDAAPWLRWLRPFYIIRETSPVISIHCHPGHTGEAVHWELTTEAGSVSTGVLVPEQLQETGEYYIDGIRYGAYRFPLDILSPGYHSLALSTDTRRETALVIVCPHQCHNLAMTDGNRLWGISCQLYTLRSERNWGIGDFSDLLELISLAAGFGADMIGLNPLHAPCGVTPDAVSPYSPSDRRFLNPLYIDPEAVAEFAETPGLAETIRGAAFQQKLEVLRQGGWVDYAAVSTLKYTTFEQLYKTFMEKHVAAGSHRALEFQDFVARQGKELEAFARHETGHNVHGRDFASDTGFYLYLQWLAILQLENCQKTAILKGMKVGLMGDLAVGSVASGSEVCTNPELYIPRVTIGAPPDPFSSQGQDWGLPVINPLAMVRNRYCHFISLLRANLAPCGALRIDHAMALMRLWWCLPEDGHNPALGIYVYYAMNDLMALLCLESARNRCLIIGEDLGVVPGAFRHAMAEQGIHGNRLLYFMQRHDHSFIPPVEFPEDSLLMVTNHDVPTLADWWSAGDINRRASLGLLPGEGAENAALEERTRDKQQLLAWLEGSRVLPEHWKTDSLDREFDMNLCGAIHRSCARSASRLMLLQLEDMQLLTEPVNIPGTYREYPNWRRKQRLNTRDILADPAVIDLLEQVNRERKA